MPINFRETLPSTFGQDEDEVLSINATAPGRVSWEPVSAIPSPGPRPYGDILGQVDAANRDALIAGTYPADDALDSLVNQGMLATTMAGSMGIIPKGMYLLLREHEWFKKSVRLDFVHGWSADQGIGANERGSVLMYSGALGDDVLTFRACWGVEVNGMKIAVKPGTPRPRSLVRVTQVPGDSNTNNFLSFRRLCLGQLSGFDVGHVSGEFDYGFLMDGINGNDSMYYEMIVVFGAAIDGVHIDNSQGVSQQWNGLFVYAAGRDALHTNASIDVPMFGANSCNGHSVYVVGGTKCHVGNLYSEGCKRFYTVEANSRLEVDLGYYDMGNVHADGIMGDTPGVSQTRVILHNFDFTGTPPVGVTPLLRLNPGTTCGRELVLDDVEGLVEANIQAALTADTPNDWRIVRGFKRSTGQRFRNEIRGGGGFAMVPSVCGLPNIDFNRWDEAYA